MANHEFKFHESFNAEGIANKHYLVSIGSNVMIKDKTILVKVTNLCHSSVTESALKGFPNGKLLEII